MDVQIVDKELKVMQEVVDSLQKLDEVERVRVVRWFCERFLTGNNELGSRNYTHVKNINMHLDGNLLSRLQDNSEIKTEGDKVLAVMEWLRDNEARGEITAYEVNQELKKVGMRVGNITSAFSELVKKGLVVQVDKKGRFKQGRKRYKLRNF
jgi:hypothetical protein